MYVVHWTIFQWVIQTDLRNSWIIYFIEYFSLSSSEASDTVSTVENGNRTVDMRLERTCYCWAIQIMNDFIQWIWISKSSSKLKDFTFALQYSGAIEIEFTVSVFMSSGHFVQIEYSFPSKGVLFSRKTNSQLVLLTAKTEHIVFFTIFNQN